MPVTDHDRQILRRLAARQREIAELPEMAARKQRLRDLNGLKPDRPVVLCFPEGAWVELVAPDSAECEDPLLRRWELDLRGRIFWWDHIHDDNAAEPWFEVDRVVAHGDFGVEIPYEHGANRGSYVWDPPIKDFATDMAKLRFRQPVYDPAETDRRMALADELFGDLLPARLRCRSIWTCGLTWTCITLIGLQRLMLAMYDEPAELHRLMKWLGDEMIHFLRWHESRGLYTMNNTNGWVGSGGVAYTDQLPAPGWSEGDPPRLKDLWGNAESQETVGVSPEMFAEFILPYQLPLMELFGLNCYGCCEPIHSRWEHVKRIPNLRRVSVSPWCDQAFMVEAMGGDYIFSRKPNPTHVCASFNEDAIRADLRSTLAVAADLPLEIILKDTHTVQGEPDRLGRWVRIALEEVEAHAG